MNITLTGAEAAEIEAECIAALATGTAAAPQGEALRRLLGSLIQNNTIDSELLSRTVIHEVAGAVRAAGFKRSAAAIAAALDAAAA